MSQPTLVCRIPQNLWRFALSGGNACRSGHWVLWAKNSTDIFHNMIGTGHFKGKSTIKGFVLLYPLNRTPSLRLCTCWFRIFRLCTCLYRTELRTCRQDFETVYLYVLVQVFEIVYMLAQDLGIVYVSVRDWDRVRVDAGLRLCTCLCRLFRLCTCWCRIWDCRCRIETVYGLVQDWDYVRVCEGFWDYVRVCAGFWDCVRVGARFSDCVRLCTGQAII